jgi:type VI secretion system protein VasD
VAQVKLTASADVNPTASGAGAPVVVRVYQLGSSAGFDKAEFFPLLNTDAATLGQDLVKRDEYLMTPGTTKEAALTVPDTVKAIGVFAAYRNFRTETWRATVPLPPHKTTPVTISLTATGLVVAPGP